MALQPGSIPSLLSIGQLAALTDTPVTTLRYYEKRGLIPPPQREGGRRRYGPEVIMRLMLIRFCRIAGLGLDAIIEVISDVTPGREITKRIASERVAAIDAQMATLHLARDMMDAASRCRCGNVEQCRCGVMQPVIERVRAAGGR